MNGQNRKNIRPGITVDIVLKEDQPSGKLTRGVVAQILTSKSVHPRGIKVRLADGQVGRVQNIMENAPEKIPASPRPLRDRRGGRGEARRGFRGRADSSGRSASGRSRGSGSGRTFERGPQKAEPEFFGPIKKSACDCCGFLTLGRKNIYEVCHVCYWEDDPAHSQNPKEVGGSNHISLEQARANFIKFGACEEKYAKAVSKPSPEEIPAQARPVQAEAV